MASKQGPARSNSSPVHSPRPINIRGHLGSNPVVAEFYLSARITRVSGWTPSDFIASAAGSVCMNS
jgi:hypothetical protein